MKLPIGPRTYVPDCRRFLLAESEYFVAGAEFERKDGVWRIVRFAPVLGWMKKMPFDQIKNELIRRGYRWEWREITA